MLRSWEWSPHEWDWCSYKRDPQRPLSPSAMWGFSKNTPAMNRKRDLRGKQPWWHLDLQLLASRTVRTDAFLSTLICSIMLELSEWTKTVEQAIVCTRVKFNGKVHPYLNSWDNSRGPIQKFQHLLYSLSSSLYMLETLWRSHLFTVSPRPTLYMSSLPSSPWLHCGDLLNLSPSLFHQCSSEGSVFSALYQICIPRSPG